MRFAIAALWGWIGLTLICAPCSIPSGTTEIDDIFLNSHSTTILDCCCFNNAVGSEPTIVPGESQKALLSVDYTELISLAPALKNMHFSSPFNKDWDDLELEDYSFKELSLMGGWLNEEGGLVSITPVHRQAAFFYEETGRLPRDAAELLEWIWGSPKAVDDFLALPKEKQFEDIRNYINPITGKLYDTFEATEWRSGGVRFRLLNNQQEADAVFGQRAGASLFPQALSAWEVFLYGEAPGNILGSHPILLIEMDSPAVIRAAQ